MDRAGASSWKEEVDFLCDLGRGLPALPVEVAILMTSLPQGQPAEDARQGHLLHEHPWVLRLGLGFSPVSWTLLLRKNLLLCTAYVLSKLPRSASKEDDPARDVSQNLGKTKGLREPQGLSGSPHRALGLTHPSYSFSP